jgi:hypothetical protein
MENKIDIKKEWEAPSLEKLEVIKTLGGDGNFESGLGGEGPVASNGG